MNRTRARFAVLTLGAASLITGCASIPAGDATVSTAAPGVTVASDPATRPAATAPTGPTKASYEITVKTLTKDCFGSAGCVVDVRLNVTMVGEEALNRAAELSVSITGGQDGAEVETITVDDQGKYDAPEVTLQTASNKTKIKAKVTDVEVTDG